MKYVPIILSGIVFIMGANVLLSLRDSKVLNKIEERNAIIYRQLEVVPYSPDSN